MVVDGAHFKNTLAVGQLEICYLQHHAERLDQVDNTHEKEQLRPADAVSHGHHRAPQEHTARIAHKRFGRVKVPRKEARAAARHGRGKQRHGSVSQKAGDKHEAHHYNKGDAGRQPVDAVRQVDGVHHADDEEEREDVKEPAEVHRAQQR